MGEEAKISGRPVASPAKSGTGVSRRAFLGHLATASAGAIVFSGVATGRAKAQYGAPVMDGLPPEQLTTMYTDMLKIRLWETKIKDLLLAGGFRGGVAVDRPLH